MKVYTYSIGEENSTNTTLNFCIVQIKLYWKLILFQFRELHASSPALSKLSILPRHEYYPAALVAYAAVTSKFLDQLESLK